MKIKEEIQEFKNAQKSMRAIDLLEIDALLRKLKMAQIVIDLKSDFKYIKYLHEDHFHALGIEKNNDAIRVYKWKNVAPYSINEVNEVIIQQLISEVIKITEIALVYYSLAFKIDFHEDWREVIQREPRYNPPKTLEETEMDDDLFGIVKYR